VVRRGMGGSLRTPLRQPLQCQRPNLPGVVWRLSGGEECRISAYAPATASAMHTTTCFTRRRYSPRNPPESHTPAVRQDGGGKAKVTRERSGGPKPDSGMIIDAIRAVTVTRVVMPKRLQNHIHIVDQGQPSRRWWRPGIVTELGGREENGARQENGRWDRQETTGYIQQAFQAARREVKRRSTFHTRRQRMENNIRNKCYS